MPLKRQRGFSLLELMISLTIGLLILLILSQILVDMLTIQSQDKRRSQLTGMVDSAMSLMAMELRRAGFQAAPDTPGNPFGQVFIDNSKSCIRYAYDTPPGENLPGDTHRYFAFRLKKDTASGTSTLQRLQADQANWRCTAADHLWQDMSKDTLGQVSRLQFDTVQNGIRIRLQAREASPLPQALKLDITTTVTLRNRPEVSGA